jgi:tetratricopeptide (TPR) repeat protein
VGLFGKPTYDRNDTLARAGRAERKRKHKKAIGLYKTVLAQEPDNTAVIAKLAVLLAKTKQPDEARRKFVTAAEQFVKEAFDEKAIAIYRQAVTFFPQQIEYWERIAKLNVERKREPDAIQALLDGRREFRRRKERASAIRLLREAVRIEPWHFEATLDLARLLAKQGSRAESQRLYQGLCERKRGAQLRKTRGALFFRTPTPATAWRWVRAAIRGY